MTLKHSSGLRRAVHAAVGMVDQAAVKGRAWSHLANGHVCERIGATRVRRPRLMVIDAVKMNSKKPSTVDNGAGDFVSNPAA
jgi:hypothetical protein